MSKYEMPIYEVKYRETDEWVEISDVELMDQLYKTYKKVTPAIKEMIMGKELETHHGTYRLKLKGGVKDVEPSGLSSICGFCT